MLIKSVWFTLPVLVSFFSGVTPALADELLERLRARKVLMVAASFNNMSADLLKYKDKATGEVKGLARREARRIAKLKCFSRKG